MQSIPDDKLREMFCPTPLPQPGWPTGGQRQRPQRGRAYPRVKPNDPEAFLDALVQRKNHLADDLGELYRRSPGIGVAEPAPGGEPLTKPEAQTRQQLMGSRIGPGRHELGRPQTKTPDYWQLPGRLGRRRLRGRRMVNLTYVGAGRLMTSTSATTPTC